VISLGSLAGFLALLSIAVRNGMSLVRHFQDLQRNDGVAFGSELVLRGTRERLVPKGVSAGGIAVAFIPFAWYGGRPGMELMHPVAIVILGGLVTSTSLGLIGVPALYLLYGRKSEHTVSMEADMNVDISEAGVEPAISLPRASPA